jgi:hypothetical protein
MLVEAFLDHNLESGDIVITKFSYEYYKWKSERLFELSAL